MSTVANTRTANSGSSSATVFIAVTVMAASAMVVEGGRHVDSWHVWEFCGLLLVSTVTARLKIKLPGLSSNMSVSLPFLLVAMTRLNLLEMLITAAVSVFTQSVPRSPHKFIAVHALFNVATGVLATGLGLEAFHRAVSAHANATAALLLGCSTYLISSTFPLAGIIALTEQQKVFRTWSEIVHLSFPYYVASTGLASMALSLQGNTSWSLLVGMALITLVMYRSFCRYFGFVSAGSSAPTRDVARKVVAAAAGV